MKQTKFTYYLYNILAFLVPKFIYRYQTKNLLANITEAEKEELQVRVNYYAKGTESFTVLKDNNSSYAQTSTFRDMDPSAYFFDLHQIVRCLPAEFTFNYIFGDVCGIPASPSFVKSRPISGDNHNSVVLKLDKIRHFQFVDDPTSYEQKKDMIVWRGAAYQEHRRIAVESFYNNPRCNIGQNAPRNGNPWEKSFLSIKEQLGYKFLLALEGNDVASSLKWMMSSNSLVFMLKPVYETWFMEGLLEANVHYVELKADYSDLIEKMDYYLANTDKALQIISNAHSWVAKFKDERKEHLTSLMVASKYFELSGQSKK